MCVRAQKPPVGGKQVTHFHQENKTMSCCMQCSAWVCRLWLAVVLWSCVISRVHCVKVTVRTVTFTQCTQLTMQLHKTTANHSLHTQAEHRMQQDMVLFS